jgi:hypothetical protein
MLLVGMPEDAKTVLTLVLTSVLRRLSIIELKLDVLIESQGLGVAIEEREAQEQQRLDLNAAETVEQFRDALRRGQA